MAGVATEVLPARAAIYCRISKDDAGDMLGVRRQEGDCRKLCAARGWEVGEVFIDDDLSAYKRKVVRPEYQRMLKAIAARQVDAVVVWALDRLHRQPRELEAFLDTCESAGLSKMACVAGDVDLGTSEGRLVARIMGAVDAKASDDTSRRLRRKLQEVAESGKPWGRRSFGYDQDGAVNEAEAAVVQEMVEAALAGRSYRSIAVELNAKAVPTSQGGRGWGAATVRQVLFNPAITGLRVYRGTVIGQGAWEPIVDRGTWAKLRAALDRPDRRAVSSPRRGLLSSLVFCGRCGHGLAYTRAERAERAGPRRAMRCVNLPGRPPACGNLSINAGPLERFVSEAVLIALPEVVERSARPVDDTPLEGEDPAEVEARLRELAKMWAAGKVSRAEWVVARAELQRRLAAAQSALVVSQRGARHLGVDLVSVRQRWPQLTLAEQHEVIALVIDRVTVAPAGRTGRVFQPGRVSITWRA